MVSKRKGSYWKYRNKEKPRRRQELKEKLRKRLKEKPKKRKDFDY